MKAIIFRENGGADRLELAEMETPAPGPGQILVQVKACGLNHLDIWARKGMPVDIPMPHIGGCDVAGVVAELGEGVSGSKIGDRVIICPGQVSGRYADDYPGNEPIHPDFQIFGFHTQGGFAEYCVTDARHVVPVPRVLSHEEWAAIPLVFITAYHMLFTRGGLKENERVLVHGAGSGLGSAAIQLAKLAGATVITTSSNDQKLARAVSELHADATVNYQNTDIVSAVKDWTGGRGVNLVIESIGPDVWDASLASLAPGGRLVTAGATSGPNVSMSLRSLYMRSISVHGSYMGSRWELDKIVELAEARRIKPVVDHIFPLAETANAQTRMENRENFGKIIVSNEVAV
ncbi:MAG: zinc-binding dehydrogenase [Candidatus Sumerlaeaceae bacterium]|nr:zinc-binding dehydrogenase [Candidatus Sumerlaeaceae bacterium]